MSEGLQKKMDEFIKFPVTQADMQRRVDGFQAVAGIPRVVGVVDCTHVKLTSPGGGKPQNFINSAGWYSINVQVCYIGTGSNKLGLCVLNWDCAC